MKTTCHFTFELQLKFMVVLIIAILLIILLSYILFAPFFLEIDTTNGLYIVRFHHLASIRFSSDECSLWLTLKIAFWKKQFDLLSPPPMKIESAKKKQRKRKPGSIPTKRMLKRIKEVLRSFYLNKCYINLDTGSMPVNGILYPWFYLLGRHTGNTIMINFNGNNEIILQTENSLARMLWAYLRS
jgi:hypothetical protein